MNWKTILLICQFPPIKFPAGLFCRYGLADSKMHIHKDIPGGLLAETPNSHAGGQVPSLVRELDPTCHS